MLTLGKINEFAKCRGNQPAVVNYENQLTWNQLRDLAESKVAYLVGRYGDNMPRQACYIANNRLDLFPWLAAFATLGIPVTGIDYTLPLASIESMAQKIGADFVLFSSTLLQVDGAFPELMAGPAMGGMSLDLDSPSMVATDSIGNLLKTYGYTLPPARPFRAVGFTSGTSSLPKAVLRSRSFDQRRFEYFSSRYGFGGHDRFMVAMPLYHAAGNGWARLFMSLGATLYLVDSDDTAAMADTLDTHAITATVFSPALLAGVLHHRGRQGARQPKALKWVLIGGRNFTAVEKKRALDGLGPVVYEYYGTTESGVNTIAEPADLLHYPQSVGRAYDGNRVAIVSADGRVLAAGEIGRVCIASYMNMDDYLDGNGQFVVLDGGERYFVTPDQGYLDPEGRLYLLNRSGGNGQDIPLYKLENALRQLPCIEDVALLLHEGAQKTTVQCVYTSKAVSDGAGRLRHRILEAAGQERILLGQCKQVAHIPYSPSGKVRVSDLEKLLATA